MLLHLDKENFKKLIDTIEKLISYKRQEEKIRIGGIDSNTKIKILVSHRGFEPPTVRLRVCCSTS